jgi:hypothetical protein
MDISDKLQQLVDDAFDRALENGYTKFVMLESPEIVGDDMESTDSDIEAFGQQYITDNGDTEEVGKKWSRMLHRCVSKKQKTWKEDQLKLVQQVKDEVTFLRKSEVISAGGADKIGKLADLLKNLVEEE